AERGETTDIPQHELAAAALHPVEQAADLEAVTAAQETGAPPGPPATAADQSTAAAFSPAAQDDLAPSGQVARIRANVAALQVLRVIQAEGRPASPQEQQILARWSGWGAVPGVFDPNRDDHAAYQWARTELAALLSDDEYAAARRTVLNAHYTDAGVVQAVWNAVGQLGFTGGDVLEPGSGSGNFIGFAPAGARMVGVELDPTTAAISAALYPHARILAESFADSRLPHAGFDMVVGNVPFGDIVLSDPLHNPGEHSIHNHFIIKGLHLLKPGGTMAVLTSRYTLDAVNPAARREIAGLADLIGAVRLPSGAMARAAGTDAIVDVLILRRREPDRAPLDAEAWERTRVFDDAGQTARVNGYFLEHPEHVLGTLAIGRGQYRADDVLVHGDKDCAAALGEALDTITASAAARGLTHRPHTDSQPLAPIAVTAAAERMPEGYLTARPDGTFTQVVGGKPTAYTPPQTQAAELRSLLQLRDMAMRLLSAEGRHRDDTAEIDALRRRLGTAYDSYLNTHGPINRFTIGESGKVDAETGEPIMRRTFPPQGGFRADPWSSLVYALEDFDEAAQKAHKTAIFSKRVIGPRNPRMGAETAADAIAICRDVYGTLSLDRIAWLLGVDEDEARRQLGTLVFDDPATGRMVAAAEYLSGNVRTKLAQAEEAAAGDERYAPNVEALTAVIPPNLTTQDIRVRLGAVWINAATVQSFLREILADPTVVVEHDRGSLWEVRSSRKDSTLATSTWGTDRVNAIDLAAALLNQKSLQVYDRNKITGERKPNAEATLAVNAKAAELNDKFVSWLWSDPERATWHLNHYNDTFNSLVLRSYDGIELSLPGLALTFKPHPHQYAAVARIVSEPSVGLFHEVGAGKTAEMVMGSQELKRLGLVRKPMIIVPNHMLEQFTREYMQLYPNANLLAASSADLRGKKRQLFRARATTSDWDAIIMTHRSFEMIAMSVQAQRTFLKAKVKKLEDRLELAQQRDEKMLVKALEKQIARTEEHIKKKLNGRKDDGLTFEDLGVDYLFVDEAHLFKNLARASRIPGMTVAPGSNRATDLEMKLHWLRQQVDADGQPRKRVCTLATATPISNSIGEIHTMLMYLAPELMTAHGIEEFDAFAATFGETVEAIEVKPEGGGL
ncbi:MAG: helicase, partial [Saccharothrix sp.]|nr:helicase [Saccharothrix sp.]